MGLHDLQPAPGSTKAPKRKGRCPGSGNGKTAGKGHKGSKARAGGFNKLGVEGGQMPMYRRIPKRGFRNDLFETRYQVVNVGALVGIDAGQVVDLEFLVVSGRLKLDRLKQTTPRRRDWTLLFPKHQIPSVIQTPSMEH